MLCRDAAMELEMLGKSVIMEDKMDALSTVSSIQDILALEPLEQGHYVLKLCHLSVVMESEVQAKTAITEIDLVAKQIVKLIQDFSVMEILAAHHSVLEIQL